MFPLSGLSSYGTHLDPGTSREGGAILTFAVGFLVTFAVSHAL